MVVLRVVLLLLAAIFAGCLTDPDSIPGASHWDWTVEQSMHPDFSEDGPSYPILLLHQHAAPSKRMEKEWRENPVVCSTVAGQPIELPSPLRDAAPCEGPASNPGTGRLFVDRETFDSWDARAVVVRADDCWGGAFALDAGRLEFVVESPEHAFLVAYQEDGTFLVDGKHVLQRGQTLKATYWIDYGNPEDQRFVRVVLDYPGEWLESQVGVREGGSIYRPDTGSYRDDGEVLAARISRVPSELSQILEPLRGATEGNGSSVVDLQFTIAGEVLTDVSATIHSDRGLTHWFLASREGDELRVLGNRVEGGEPGIDPELLPATFAGPLSQLAGDGIVHSYQLDPHNAYDDPAPVMLVEPDDAGCTECIYLWGGLVEDHWRFTPQAQARGTAGALTLRVTSYEADGGETLRVYHRAEA